MTAVTCHRGHPQTPENVYERPSGGQVCRRCAAELARQARAAEKEPLPVLRPPAWMDESLCRTGDPDAWFPDKGGRAAARMAIKICGQCPVRAACLEYALDNGERIGIWGGTSGNQRRAMWRARRADRLAS